MNWNNNPSWLKTTLKEKGTSIYTEPLINAHGYNKASPTMLAKIIGNLLPRKVDKCPPNIPPNIASNIAPKFATKFVTADIALLTK